MPSEGSLISRTHPAVVRYTSGPIRFLKPALTPPMTYVTRLRRNARSQTLVPIPLVKKVPRHEPHCMSTSADIGLINGEQAGRGGKYT
jgi:hypothetical protein